MSASLIHERRPNCAAGGYCLTTPQFCLSRSGKHVSSSSNCCCCWCSGCGICTVCDCEVSQVSVISVRQIVSRYVLQSLSQSKTSPPRKLTIPANASITRRTTMPATFTVISKLSFRQRLRGNIFGANLAKIAESCRSLHNAPKIDRV